MKKLFQEKNLGTFWINVNILSKIDHSFRKSEIKLPLFSRWLNFVTKFTWLGANNSVFYTCLSTLLPLLLSNLSHPNFSSLLTSFSIFAGFIISRKYFPLMFDIPSCKFVPSYVKVASIAFIPDPGYFPRHSKLFPFHLTFRFWNVYSIKE